jgi:hypothetical protein
MAYFIIPPISLIGETIPGIHSQIPTHMAGEGRLEAEF